MSQEEAETRREQQGILKEIIEKQEERIKDLQSNGFKTANAHFISQAIVFTAVSTGTTLKCRDVWFPITVSLIPTFLNIFSLLMIGRSYVRALKEQQDLWIKYDRPMWMSEDMIGQSEGFRTRFAESAKQAHYILLILYIFCVCSYALAMCFGSWWILCR